MTDAPPPAAPRRPDAVAKLRVPEAERAKSFTLVTVSTVALLCVVAVGLNVAVNPRSEFPVHGLRPLVVDRVHDAVRGYQARGAPAQDLVLGTSRAGLIRGLPGREDVTFNFFIAGSPPQDWLDLYHYVKREQGPPVNLILVVDQSSFTDVFAPRVPTSADAGTVLGAPPTAGDRAALALRSLSVSYLRDTVHSLRLRYVTGYPPPASGEPLPIFARPDLMDAYRNGTFHPADLNPAVDAQFQRAFGPAEVLVPANRDALHALVAEALADGVHVRALLPPYQPVVLADLQARFPAFDAQVAQVRAELTAFCPVVPVTDATDPAVAGIDGRQFYDQDHPTQAGSDQMVQAMVDHRADACAAAAAGS